MPLARLTAHGSAGQRDEYWRYTDPSALNATDAPSGGVCSGATKRRCSTSVDRLQVVFVDGVFDAEASDDLALSGLEIERLADAQPICHWAHELYGMLESAGQTRSRGPWRR